MIHAYDSTSYEYELRLESVRDLQLYTHLLVCAIDTIFIEPLRFTARTARTARAQPVQPAQPVGGSAVTAQL
eukprot:3707217-Prymnesium_polylepis.2